MRAIDAPHITRIKRLRPSTVRGLALFAVALVMSAVIAPSPAPALEAGTTDVRVATGADDAEELGNRFVDFTSTDLELTVEKVPQTVGIRFGALAIPPGATITAAWIQFTVDETNTAPATLMLRAQDDPNPQPFSGTGNITGRAVMASMVEWSPDAWPTVGAAGPAQRTPDLAPILQPVISRPDWVQGNALVVIITGTGTRTAESFEGGPAFAPVLHVEWTLGTPGSTTSAPSTTTSSQPTTTTTLAQTTTTASGPTTTTTSTPVTTTTSAPPVGGTFETRVTTGGGDVEQITNGWIYAGSTDLELVDDVGTQTIGLRFTAVGIPAGATITNASIRFTVDETSTAPASLSVRLHDVGNAPAFVGNSNVSNRPMTASVNWIPDPWTVPGTSLAAQTTPDLTAIVQAVINRSDWATGNAIAVIITGAGTRTAAAFESGAANAALLRIDWTTDPGSGPVNQPPQVIASALPVTAGGTTTLGAAITDDGLPEPPAATTVFWEQISGPVTVAIVDPAAPTTTATLPVAGEYHFRVTVSDGKLSAQAVAAAIATPSAPSSTRIAVIGDFGDGTVREGQVADMIATAGVDAVVTTGDNVYSGAGFDRLVGRYYHERIGNYLGTYGAGAAVNQFFPSLGNHDYNDVGLPGYLSYFTLPGTGVNSSNTSGNERYYDVRIDDVHVFVINSQPQEPNGLTPATVQGAWLQSALASSDAEWKIVVFHNPPYSSIPGKSAQWMRWPFASWGADLVLSGDAHVYERLRIDGFDYAISGLGINHQELDNPVITGSRAFYSADDAGALFITACTGAMHLEYRALIAGVVDTYTIGVGTCP